DSDAEAEAADEAEDSYTALRTPAPYEPGDEGEEDEGLAEPAEDGQYGEHGSGGYASLSGTRIDRDSEGAAAAEPEEGWSEAGENDEGDALELTFEAAAAADYDEAGHGEAEEPAAQDELLLDASRLAEAD